MIAPTHPDLPSIDAEVAALTRHHEVERVIGVVRDIDILRAVENNEYDILWFATHGGPEGVLLSNGILSAEGIGQYVATSGVKLCVLNTCASEDVAFKIVAGGDTDMVYTITDQVKDEDALRFGSLFGGELAKTDNFQEAFTVAAGPGATKYRYLDAKHALRGMTLQATTALEKIADKLEALSRTVYEDGIKTKTMSDQFENIRIQFENIRVQLETMRSQFTDVRIQATTDRQMANAHGSSNTPIRQTIGSSQFSPTFYALLVLIGLIILYILVQAGLRF